MKDAPEEACEELRTPSQEGCIRLLSKHAFTLTASEGFQQDQITRMLTEWHQLLKADYSVIVSVPSDGATTTPTIQTQYPSTFTDKLKDLDGLLHSLHPPPEWSRNSPTVNWAEMRSRTLNSHAQDLSYDIATSRDALERNGFKSGVSIPIKSADRIAYLVKFFSRQPDHFTHPDSLSLYFDTLSDLMSGSYRCAEAALTIVRQTELMQTRQMLAHVGDWNMRIDDTAVNWSPVLFGLNKKLASLSLKEFIALLHPDDQRLFLKELNIAVNSYAPASFEFRLLKPRQPITWLQIRGSRIIDKKVDSDDFIATLIDVTHIKNREIKLLKSKRESDLASEEKSRFLSSMSHELRTPLNSILGFSQLLQIDSALCHDHKENVSEIIAAGTHLLNLINEVLDLSLVESGTMNALMQTIAARAIIEDAVSMITPVAKRNKISVSVAPIPELYLLVDRTKIKQALINLLSNAVKYNKPQGAINISAELVREGTLRISVSDTGIGINPDKGSELFKPFSRLGLENSEKEGTGIGLNFTQKIVHMMGGYLGYVSKEFEGSTFYMEFAATSPNARLPRPKERPVRTCNREGSPLAPRLRPDRVLLISRSPATHVTLRGTLAMMRNTELRSTDFDTYLGSMAMQRQPNIIVIDTTDQKAEDLNWEFFEQLTENAPEARVIGIVDTDSLKTLSDLLSNYCDCVCLLPIDSAAAYSVIQSQSLHADIRAF